VVVSEDNTYIIMELLSGGELFSKIVEKGAFTESDAATIFAQILLSMEHLHSLNIVHRDVKPENILYISNSSEDIKLIDFGYAGIWAPEKELTGLCGTPDYVAPEVLTWYDDDDEGRPYGKGSDMWSLGVLLYVILSGCSPFSAEEEDEEALLKEIREGKFVFHDNEWKHVSSGAKELIRGLLVVDVDKRLSMQKALEHPWLAAAVAKCRADILSVRQHGTSNVQASSTPNNKLIIQKETAQEGHGQARCSGCLIL